MTYASVTSNHGTRTILALAWFLAPKAEWQTHRNFTTILFLWSHQATIWPSMAWNGCALIFLSNKLLGPIRRPRRHRRGPARGTSLWSILYWSRRGLVQGPCVPARPNKTHTHDISSMYIWAHMPSLSFIKLVKISLILAVHLSIIINSEMWNINHCSGLGHE